MAEPTRYRSPDEDSGRWLGFRHRPGDIVISTRSKHGTTWMQMICALLVFRTPTLPRPLAELSPWLDWLVVPIDDVHSTLEAQTHRRVIKTHTPLDGLPLDPHVTYIVVARHPLDAAVSLFHQGENIDRHRLAELTGNAAVSPARPRPTLADWLRQWIDGDRPPSDDLDGLPGVVHHLRDAWERRSEPNVVTVHYHDLQVDLAGEMHGLAASLGIDLPPSDVADLAAAASFGAMRDRSAELAPDPAGVLRDRQAFFRSGTGGEWADVLDVADVERYEERLAELAPADLIRWLNR